MANPCLCEICVRANYTADEKSLWTAATKRDGERVTALLQKGVLPNVMVSGAYRDGRRWERVRVRGREGKREKESVGWREREQERERRFRGERERQAFFFTCVLTWFLTVPCMFHVQCYVSFVCEISKQLGCWRETEFKKSKGRDFMGEIMWGWEKIRDREGLLHWSKKEINSWFNFWSIFTGQGSLPFISLFKRKCESRRRERERFYWDISLLCMSFSSKGKFHLDTLLIVLLHTLSHSLSLYQFHKQCSLSFKNIWITYLSMTTPFLHTFSIWLFIF